MSEQTPEPSLGPEFKVATESETTQTENIETGSQENEAVEVPSAPHPSPTFSTEVDRQVGLARQAQLRDQAAEQRQPMINEIDAQPNHPASDYQTFDEYEYAKWEAFYEKSQREAKRMDHSIDELQAADEEAIHKDIESLYTEMAERNLLSSAWARVTGQARGEADQLAALQQRANELSFERERHVRNFESDMKAEETNLRKQLNNERETFEQGNHHTVAHDHSQGRDDEGMSQ